MIWALSRLDSPLVGSSRNSTSGLRSNSSPMFNLLRDRQKSPCPNRSDAQITCLPKSQLLEHLVHPRQLVGFRQMRQAELGVESKVLAHGKLFHKHIFLGDMADEPGHTLR